MSERTPFAGLEVLAPGEPLSTDGFRLTSIDPRIIDRLLQVGAVTHRHDAHAAIPAPAESAVLATEPAGGTIPADATLHVAFTWVDSHGGETLPSPVASITTRAGLEAPQEPPEGAVSYAAGTLLAANYDYALTLTDGAGGETLIGPALSLVVEPGHANAEITLEGLKAIMEAFGGTSWRLWRRQNGGVWYLLHEAALATYTDDGSNAGDCTVQPPTNTTAHGTSTLSITLPVGHPADAASLNIYISEEAGLTSPALLGNFPLTELGKTINLTALELTAGEPPLVTLSIPGASKIDPDTDILAWPWKREVNKVSELPTEGNESGDVRLVVETLTLYVWDSVGKDWVSISGTKVTYSTHAFTLRGPVSLEPPIPPLVPEFAAGEVAHLIAVRYQILAGTSLSFHINRNGAPVPGLGTVEAPLVAKAEPKRTAASEGGPLLASGDALVPVLTTGVGEPAGASIGLIIAHTI